MVKLTNPKLVKGNSRASFSVSLWQDDLARGRYTVSLSFQISKKTNVKMSDVYFRVVDTYTQETLFVSRSIDPKDVSRKSLQFDFVKSTPESKIEIRYETGFMQGCKGVEKYNPLKVLTCNVTSLSESKFEDDTVLRESFFVSRNTPFEVRDQGELSKSKGLLHLRFKNVDTEEVAYANFEVSKLHLGLRALRLPEGNYHVSVDSRKTTCASETLKTCIQSIYFDGLPLSQKGLKYEDLGVIIPHFKTPSLLLRAIRSVLAQSVKPSAIYVVDDASNIDLSKCLSQVEELCKSWNVHFEFHQLSINVGPYVCKNLILFKRLKRHQFWTFLDSDDYYTPSKIEAQLTALKGNQEVYGCYTHYARVQNGKTVLNRGLESRKCYASLLFRRELIDIVGYFDSVRFGADEDFNKRVLLALGKNALCVDKGVHYLAECRQDSLTQDVNIQNTTETTPQDFLSPLRLKYSKFSTQRVEATQVVKLPPFYAFEHEGLSEIASLPSILLNIASYPKRFEDLKRILESLIGLEEFKFTKLKVCLNEVEVLPHEFEALAKDSRVMFYTSNKDLKDNGKFIDVDLGINFWLDDDFELGASYFFTHIANMLIRKENTLLSFHGWSGESYERSKKDLYHFNAFISEDTHVDIVGTGLSAMLLTQKHIQLGLKRVIYNEDLGMVDLLVSEVCARLGIPRIVLQHTPLEEDLSSVLQNEETLFSTNNEQSRVETINNYLSTIRALDLLNAEHTQNDVVVTRLT